MESIEVNGKTFTFTRQTIYFIKKVARKELDKIGEKYANGFLDDNELVKFRKQWKVFCSTVFEKSLFWKLGIFPKELKVENMIVWDVPRVIKTFFDLLGATLQGLKEQSGLLQGSATQITKSLTPSQKGTS